MQKSIAEACNDVMSTGMEAEDIVVDLIAGIRIYSSAAMVSTLNRQSGFYYITHDYTYLLFKGWLDPDLF